MRDFVLHELVAVNTLLHAARRLASSASGEDKKYLEELTAQIMSLYWVLRDIAEGLGIPVWGAITPQFDWDALDPERLALAYVFAWAAEQGNLGDLLAALEAYKEERLRTNSPNLSRYLDALRSISPPPQYIYVKYLDPGRQSFINKATISAVRKNVLT